MPNSALYNIPFVIQFDGPLDISLLQQSINTIVHRHEILRTTFNDNLEQFIIDDVIYPIQNIDLSHSKDPASEAVLLMKSEAEQKFPSCQSSTMQFYYL